MHQGDSAPWTHGHVNDLPVTSMKEESNSLCLPLTLSFYLTGIGEAGSRPQRETEEFSKDRHRNQEHFDDNKGQFIHLKSGCCVRARTNVQRLLGSSE
jgi:hypothetical protein